MQINLRKANALQSEIRKAISSVNAVNNVTVTEFTQDVGAALDKAAAEHNQAVFKKVALNSALFKIRAAVGKANADSGINEVLAQVQELEALISIKSSVASSQVRKDISEINARIEKMKGATSERSVLYGDRYNNVETSVVSQSDIDQAKTEVKTLKRVRQDLNDKLLQLNVNTLITLSEDTKATLRDEGLI